MVRKKKIKECLPIVDGLWTKINYELPDIFDLEPSQLDIIFLSNWAQRYAAPIIDVIREDTGVTMLNSVELQRLASIITGMYAHKWDKMFAVALAEYDPMHNYYDELSEHITYGEQVSGNKSSTGSNSNTRTDNLSESRSETSTRTDNLSEVKTDARQVTETRNLANSGTDSSQEGIYGFNSSTAVGDRNASGSNSGSETGTITTVNSGNITTANTGTQGNSSSGSTTNTGTQANVGSNTYSESNGNATIGDKTREYTKTGNIGNISTQKLLNEELELWKYNFIVQMMRDVVDLITLPSYETPRL